MTDMNDFIEKIKNEKIKPKPKWHFNLRGLMIWFMYLLFVIIGSLSFSIILFAIQQTDFKLLSHIGHTKLELFLTILPFIWIVLLILFILGSIYAIYNSDKGYKFTFSKLIGFSVGLSILIGTLFFIGGGAGWFENTFAIRSGFYEGIQNRKEKVWQNPENGSLGGTIIEVRENTIELKDFEENIWTINIDTAFIRNSVNLESGEKIKLTGVKTSKTTFIAEDLYPWGGIGKRNKMQNRSNTHKIN